MATSEILELQWLEHPNIFNQAIVSLRNKNSFTDATLACEGKFYPVHKFVLSTCSEYFNAIFEWTPCVNPVVVINNISTIHLEPLLDFMYRGETNVQECYIQDVMKAAECLHIKGLYLRQDDINLAKNRLRSLVSEEPKKKRRKSETKKKFTSPVFKPPSSLSESSGIGTGTSTSVYGSQNTLPSLLSSIASRKPTPTTPPTAPIHHQSSPHCTTSAAPILQFTPHCTPSTASVLQSSSHCTPPTVPIHHHSSPHCTPPIHSPSLQSSFALSLASTPPPSSQASLQSNHSMTDLSNPKALLSPAPQLSNQTPQIIKSYSSYKDVSTSSPIEIHNLQPMSVFTVQQRDLFSCLKETQGNLILPSLSNVSVSESTALPSTQEATPFRRYSSTILPDRIIHEGQIAHDGVSTTLSHLDQKMIGIGEELHLDGPVKELQIATEDGTVSIPEILEDLVHMRHLYDSKSDAFSENSSKPQEVDILPQESTSGPSVNLLHFKEETNESMYEFTEDVHEHSGGIGRLKLMKENTLKVYSNNGSAMKRKYNSEQSESSSCSLASHPSSGPPPSSPGFAIAGEPSKPASSAAKSSSPAGGDTKTEVKGPFQCTSCSKSCKTKDSLNRHLRTHTEFPYVCKVCSHKCKAYKEFIAHRKIHATKRCDKCEFVTSRNDNLRRHMVTHSEEKNHKCPYPDCSYSASRANLLSNHVLNNHKKKLPKKEEPPAS